MKRLIGFENSNSRIKGLSEVGSPVDYPNTLKQVLRISKSGMAKGETYEVNGKYYRVGALSDYGSGSKDKSRYTSEQFKIETSIGLSKMCNNGDVLKIVTGLPANLSNDDDLINEMKYNLIDTYEVGDGKSKKRFKVESVGIVSQPVGTLWSMFYDVNGKQIVDDSMFSENFLIIDIGFGTTDMVILSAEHGLEDDSNKTLVDLAMSNYISNVYNGIELNIQKSEISSTGITPYALDEQMRNSNKIKLPTGEFDIKEIKDFYQNEFALNLKQRLGQFGYSFNQFHKMILTGGGASVLGDAIKAVYNEEQRKRITTLDNPRFANVTGFYIMSKQMYS